MHLPFVSTIHISIGTYELPRETMTNTKNIISLDLEGVISPQKASLHHEDIFEGDGSVALMSTLVFRSRS